MAVTSVPEVRLRGALSLAGSATLIGIALAATGRPDLGGVITLAGLVGLIIGLHRFGRSGPDEPVELGGD